MEFEREANPNSMDNRRSTAELPDDIIQHIHTFLNPNEAAQTILLSKSWLRALSSRSFLFFNFLDISTTKGKNVYPDNNPSDVIDRTLQSYLDRKIPIVKFHLRIKTIEERWLKLVRQSNVLELDLTATAPSNWTDSILRDIFHTESLQVLRLKSSLFPFVLSRRIDRIKCINLKKLELCRMEMSQFTFQLIMCSCPWMKELVLENFEFIDLYGTYYLGIQSFMRGRECASLKRLSLVDTKINDEQLHTILSRSPQLEDLNIIGRGKFVQPINLANVALKRVNLSRSLVQVVLIDTPNLQKLKFESCRVWPNPFPITITSPITKGVVNVTIVYDDLEIDESWFLGLRRFLKKFALVNLEFISHFDQPLSFDFKVLRATPLLPLHAVETLRFKIYKDLVLLYAFFNICHPKMVLLDRLDTMSKRIFLINLLEDIRSRGNLECCNLYQNKCWRYYIKDAKLYYVVNNEKKRLDISGLKTGLGIKESITLDLEWKSSD